MNTNIKTRSRLKVIVHQLFAAALFGGTTWAAAYACAVLTQMDCVALNSTCKVGNLGGTISATTKTDQCSDGSPGRKDCGEDGTNTVSCTYTCRVGTSDYSGRTTTVQKYKLSGDSCP